MTVTSAVMPRRPGTKTSTVRLHADLAHKLNVISVATGESSAEYLSRLARKDIERDFLKAMAQLERLKPQGN